MLCSEGCAKVWTTYCALTLGALIGFLTCALCTIAAEADREYER